MMIVIEKLITTLAGHGMELVYDDFRQYYLIRSSLNQSIFLTPHKSGAIWGSRSLCWRWATQTDAKITSMKFGDKPEPTIPYDEIDQQDDESQEQLALFPAPKRTKEDLLTLLRFRYGKKGATKSSQFLVKIRRARLAKAPRS